MTRPAAPIEHIIVLMMENHGFDRMLGCMQEYYPGLDGVDPAHPLSNPDPSTGRTVFQVATTTRNIDRDPRHDLGNAMRQLADNTNQGFVADYVRTHPSSTPEERDEVMAYFPRGFLPALHTLAENFVVCDRWFSSLPGPTWINRLFAHSGTSLGHVQEPEDLFDPNLHLYDQRTLYDELSDAGVPWRIYYGDVPQTLVLTHQWRHLSRYHAFSGWERDIAAGDLPGYSFIEPSYFPPHQNDQHPPHDVKRGDALIAQVYNALRANPALFARTLLLVLYDEHGGFFDHVVPPATIPPDEHTEHYSFTQLGFRVPAVLVSPWLDPGVLSTVFDHTSLLRMASGHWPGVQPLGRRAAVANTPLDAVTWRATPRTDLPAAPIAPDLQPARRLRLRRGFARSLDRFSLALQRERRHGWLSRLLYPLEDALSDGVRQGLRAAGRVERFLAEARD